MTNRNGMVLANILFLHGPLCPNRGKVCKKAYSFCVDFRSQTPQHYSRSALDSSLMPRSLMPCSNLSAISQTRTTMTTMRILNKVRKNGLVSSFPGFLFCAYIPFANRGSPICPHFDLQHFEISLLLYGVFVFE